MKKSGFRNVETMSELKKLFTCRQLEIRVQDNMFQDYYSKECEKLKLESTVIKEQPLCNEMQNNLY